MTSLHPSETVVNDPGETLVPEAVVPETSDIVVGDGIVATDTRWSFGGATHEHFDSHVNRSVPLYQEGHLLIDQAIEFFSRPGSRIIDVGCSTGTLLERLAVKPSSRDISLIGYDIEADMVRAARERCAHLDNVQISIGDAEGIDYSGAGAVIMYYTLQFAAPGRRQAILRRIADGLDEGGALFLFEKVLAPDARVQDIVGQLYQEYKTLNGFNANEIYNKARSLRSVMSPVSSERTKSDLLDAGFSSVVTLQKYLCFEGIMAIV
ncbi:carboxy-S-adenosyl-L-methionine synthase CmoA [Nocardioides hungaricus]